MQFSLQYILSLAFASQLVISTLAHPSAGNPYSSQLSRRSYTHNRAAHADNIAHQSILRRRNLQHATAKKLYARAGDGGSQHSGSEHSHGSHPSNNGSGQSDPVSASTGLSLHNSVHAGLTKVKAKAKGLQSEASLKKTNAKLLLARFKIEANEAVKELKEDLRAAAVKFEETCAKKASEVPNIQGVKAWLKECLESKAKEEKGFSVVRNAGHGGHGH